MPIRTGVLDEQYCVIQYICKPTVVGKFQALYCGDLDSELRGRALFICILYHHLTNNTRYLRSPTHNIIKVIKLFKNYGFIQLFKHRPMRKAAIRQF